MVYCSEKGLLPGVADYLINNRDDETDDERKQREIAFFKLIKLVKPLNGNMLISGEIIEKEFYQESEWRYTPLEDIDDTAVFQSEFESEKEDRNKDAEKHKLQFSPTDIKYIFVKNDNDIPVIIDLINNSLGQYPLNDLKILSSRIISLTTIETDL